MSDLPVVGALVAVAVAVAVLQGSPPAEPPEPVQASLRVVDERVSGTRLGVLVVPVEIDNRGPAVTVEDVVVGAEPVRASPSAGGATRVAAGDTARFVVIVEPHCLVLGPGSPISFVATAAAVLRGADGQHATASVDVGRAPAVVERVGRLCGPVGQRGV